MNDCINPNDKVRVKLTKEGKFLIVLEIDRFNDDIRGRDTPTTFRASVPEWDNEGWVEGQFHILMGYFGNCWTAGQTLPFTELRKIDK